MSRPRLSGVLPLVLLWLASCGPAPSPSKPTPGAMRLAVSLPTAAPGDITRVTVTVSAADMNPMTTPLALTEGVWGGVLGEIPVGPQRTFLAQAFGAANTLRYEGRAENVSVSAGATGLVSLVLRETGVPAFTNEAPVVDALSISALTVAPGGSVSLAVTAHDPNAGDTLSYAWSAPSGTFSAPTQASTTWTASTFQDPVRLALTVSDALGAAVTVSLFVDVSTGTGTSEVKVDFNLAPVLTGLTSSRSLLDVGQQTSLSVAAKDADYDTLAYQWSATCAGTFTGATATSATFIPSQLPASRTCNNCQVRVLVTDGRGGQSTGVLSLCVSRDAAPRGPGLWTPTGALATPRVRHTATLLSSGQVLVVGGSDEVQTLALAEVYDPATGQWTATGAPASSRARHTATRLANGQVLLAGGVGGGGAVRTAELYNPVSGTFLPTGPLSAGRQFHAAALLPDGRVLVSGGFGAAGDLTSAEVYDPATGTWTPTGAMTTARRSQTMTPLASGQVLVVGGVNTGVGGLMTAELYDPASGTFHATGSLATPRMFHTATALPTGQVLIAGGFAKNSLATAELYDPASGTFQPTGSLATPREDHTATLLASGKVLVAGGTNDTTPPAFEELYDPATGDWSRTGTLLSPRQAHTATRLSSGQVLVTGGVIPSALTVLPTAELYDPGVSTP